MMIVKHNLHDMTGGSVDPQILPKHTQILSKNTEEEEFNKLCPEYNYFPSILPAVDKIIVIGDLHGDIEMTYRALQISKVVDNNMNWIGGKTVIVQIGDQVDRCRPTQFKCDDPRATINDEASDIKILKLFTELHTKAQKDGGAVYSLLGNHEIMNVVGNMNYVSYAGLDEFDDYKDPTDPSKTFKSGIEARRHAFAVGNEYGKFLGCTRTSAMIIGSNIFVHAGILPEFTHKLQLNNQDDIIKLNRAVRTWLVGKINKSHVEKIVGSFKDSMFWTRILGSIPPHINNEDPACERYLEPVLKMFNAGQMIVGHTPQFYANEEGINETCEGKLWRVDNGVSGAFDKFDATSSASDDGAKMEQRQIQVLEIIKDKEFNILK